MTDAWRAPSFGRRLGFLSFSCGFRCQGGRLLENLDIFQFGNRAAMHGGSLCFWPYTMLSDHAHVSLCIHFWPSLAPHRGCRVWGSNLTRDSLVDNIGQVLSVTGVQIRDHVAFVASCVNASNKMCCSMTTTEHCRLTCKKKSI